MTDARAVRGGRLLFVDNRPEYFASHRLPVALAARDAGFEVHVTALTAGDASPIEAEGFPFHVITDRRRSGSLLAEASVLRNVAALYRRVDPTLVHHVTLRSMLYGGLAARWTGVSAVVHGVTGLGYLYTDESLSTRFLRRAVEFFLRPALRNRKQRVTFQNPSDLELFVDRGLVAPEDATLILGSGVDVNRFVPRERPAGDVTILFASRMLWHKGVGDFVQAARRLRERGVRARCVLVGDTDPDNPSAVPLERLEEWNSEQTVEWWGYRDDMIDVFQQVDVMCLPTRYREGIPKVLIEAAATGLPVVTTDVPGCRDLVLDGRTGILVPPGDPVAVADALEELAGDAARRQSMGRHGRERVEEEFSLAHVVDETLRVYREVADGDPRRRGTPDSAR